MPARFVTLYVTVGRGMADGLTEQSRQTVVGNTQQLGQSRAGNMANGLVSQDSQR